MSGFLSTLSPTPGAQIEAIYIAYYGRAADGGGYLYWQADASSLISQGLTADQAGVQIADIFAEQNESKANYAFLKSPPAVLNPNDPVQIASVDTFINEVYNNLFNHTADQAGLQFWQNAILNGVVSVGETVYAIANGAKDSDASILGFKVEAGLNFTTQTFQAGYGASPTVPPPVNSDFVKAATDIIAPVVDATTAATAATQTQEFIALGGTWPPPGPPPLVTVTLTVGPDVVPASDGQTINGYVNTHNNTSTFQTADVINGGANSTLNITDYAHLNTPITATVSDVGVINHTLLASNTYDEALYSSVGQEWIASDTTAAGGNTLTVTNAQAATVYGIETNNVDSLNISYVAPKSTAQIALGGTKKGSTVTLANATGVDFATTGSNTIAFTGGTSLTSFVVTGDGTNSFDLTGVGAVATSDLTVDTSASTGADLVDLGTNWSDTDTIKGNGDTTLGIVTTTTSSKLAWTGVNTLQLDKGSVGNLNLTGVTGLTTVVYEAQAGGNNVTLNNVVGVDSLVFKGDGTSGNQQFGTIQFNNDVTPTLAITFENATPLKLFSDVTIGAPGGDDGIGIDGAVTVTLDTTGILLSQGDFQIWGGITDNTLQSLTFTSNGENNDLGWIKVGTNTLQTFDASKDVGNLTVAFADEDFANEANLTGAVGINHIYVGQDSKDNDHSTTVNVVLGNGGQGYFPNFTGYSDYGNFLAWADLSLHYDAEHVINGLAFSTPSDSYDFTYWQIFDAQRSGDNFNLTVGNGDNLIFTGYGTDDLTIGYGYNVISFGGQNEDINAGVQYVTLAAHPEGEDTFLIENSVGSTISITGLNAGNPTHSDVIYVLQNAHHHGDVPATTLDLGDHANGALIYAAEDPLWTGTTLNINDINHDTLNVIVGNGGDSNTYTAHTYNLDHTQGGVAGAGAPATINIYYGFAIGDNNDYNDGVNTDTFNGLIGDTININYNSVTGHLEPIYLNETVVLGAHTASSAINIYDQHDGFYTELQGFNTADKINVYTDDNSPVILNDTDTSQFANIALKVGGNADTNIFLESGNSANLTQAGATASQTGVNTISTYGVHAPDGSGTGTWGSWAGVQTVNLGDHTITDDIVLASNGGVVGGANFQNGVEIKAIASGDQLTFQGVLNAVDLGVSKIAFNSWVANLQSHSTSGTLYTDNYGGNTFVAEVSTGGSHVTTGVIDTIVELVGLHTLDTALGSSLHTVTLAV